MKKNTISPGMFKVLSFALLIFLFASCKKEVSSVTPVTTVSPATVAAASAIAVGTASSGDSVYVVGTCEEHHHADSISFAGLPAAIGAYLTANYQGYTFQKAFTDKDSLNVTEGYIVIIQFNGTPVGLKFDASGNFVKVLEQREGHDLEDGQGFHHGGRFDDRDGKHRDTISLTALPVNITAYFSANYPGDTLLHAYQNHDSGYIVLSQNNGVFATLFTSAGVFIKRAALPSEHEGHINGVLLTSLPATAQAYLTATYPNYVFKNGFTVSDNGAVQGYVVFINANATKYGVEFDPSGNFIRAVVIM